MIKKVLRWAGAVVLFAFVVLVIGRAIYLGFEERTEKAVAKIHATKLTLDDVMGKNLPPDPGPAADATVEGVDANQNGIRDDVELAIFKEYPDSAKTRAVLLQYALILQTQMTLSLLNQETVTASAEVKSRALNCIWSITSRLDRKKFREITEENENFVVNRQMNTDERRRYNDSIYKYLGSYTASREGCDVDVSNLD